MRSSKQKIKKYKENHCVTSNFSSKEMIPQSPIGVDTISSSIDAQHSNFEKGSALWTKQQGRGKNSRNKYSSQGHSVPKSYHKLK